MALTWIAVASAELGRIGRAAGFMQVCHGKGGPLRRTAPGDTVIYYSPSETFRGKDRLQASTAIGIFTDRSPYQAEMFPGFVPWRRDVDWRPTAEVPIRPLLGQLAFTRSGNWGYQLRFGLFPIEPEDSALIAASMQDDG